MAILVKESISLGGGIPKLDCWYPSKTKHDTQGGFLMSKQHPYIETLTSDLAARRIGRRDFLRTATCSGSASAAYAMAAKISGIPFVSDSCRRIAPKGGSISMQMAVPESVSSGAAIQLDQTAPAPGKRSSI